MRLVFDRSDPRSIEARLVDSMGSPLAIADLRVKSNGKVSERQYARAATLLNQDKIKLVAWVERGINEIDLSQGPSGELAFRLRSKLGSDALSFTTFAAALAAATPEDVIEWEDAEQCCAVDVDFHGGYAPPDEWGQSVAGTIRPRPAYAWRTKSGGLRLIYLPQDPYSAEDLAGVAALSILSSPLVAGTGAVLELLTRTAAPPGKWFEMTPNADVSELRRLRGEYTAEDTEYTEWLDKHSLTVGQRYPHTQCPVRPSVRAMANANPVAVYADHLFCYICAADGIIFGANAPGYFPSQRLCGTYSRTLLALCIDNFTHWSHARHLLAGFVPNQSVGRAVYRAALRCKHGFDPRVSLAFSRGAGVLRFDGFWCDASGKIIASRSGKSPLIAQLPAAMSLGEDGKAAACPVRLEWLNHTGDISDKGYPALDPIWGIRLTDGLEQASGRPTIEMYCGPSDRRPRYVPPAGRMPPDDAWAALEPLFPGIDRGPVELLLAAKGCAEFASNFPPMVFFTGPTGAGKTVSVFLAAAILGDRVTPVVYSSDDQRTRASLREAKARGSFALFDEFLKDAMRDRKTPQQALELLLNFTPDSVSHQLYVGPVPLGRMPVCVWCDTSLPEEILRHAQLCRRLIHVRLNSSKDWTGTMRAHGVNDPTEVRAAGSKEVVTACDAILSDVIDRYFAGGNKPPFFGDIAASMGYPPLLQDSGPMQEKEQAIREFFDAVVSASSLSGRLALRYKGEGWKTFQTEGDDSKLADAWRAIGSVRDVEEVDLQRVLSAGCPVTFEHREYFKRMIVRFTGSAGTNADLLRPRDAIDGRSAESRHNGIPTQSVNADNVRGLPDAGPPDVLPMDSAQSSKFNDPFGG